MRNRAWLLLSVVALAGVSGGQPLAGQGTSLSRTELAARIDRVFEKWDRSDTPGCAVCVGMGGRPIVTRAYGMANLEYGAPITVDTIFEAGSVSKQFTAASIALLVQDGKLSLDDPVRKFLPEVPDVGTPITIRHFLNHINGLRCQWPLLTLAGRPPGSAVHTTEEILDLVSRQKRLNFAPGDEFLYNNTGYTLLGVIVRRVTGQSLAEFSDARLFKPLGMTHTQWRTDHTAIVRGRATAYSTDRDGKLHTAMPFTNVYGNGGLLTTVGDLLVWNNNLDTPRVGGRPMVEQLETRGRLNDGFVNEYAEGLILSEYRGLREISHGGSTAGYQGFLARFPGQRISISLLCNLGSINAEALAHQVADIVMADQFRDRALPPAIRLSPDIVKARAGVYRNPDTGGILRIAFDKDRLRADGSELVPIAPDRCRDATGQTEYTFASTGDQGQIRVRQATSGDRPVEFVAVTPFTPTPVQLAEFAGTYYSDELDVTYLVQMDNERMVVRHRPEPAVAVQPVYADAFDFGGGRVIRFTRDRAGRVDGLEIFAGRVRHLRLVRR